MKEFEKQVREEHDANCTCSFHEHQLPTTTTNKNNLNASLNKSLFSIRNIHFNRSYDLPSTNIIKSRVSPKWVYNAQYT